jgi:hypothetical protein
MMSSPLIEPVRLFDWSSIDLTKTVGLTFMSSSPVDASNEPLSSDADMTRAGNDVQLLAFIMDAGN